MNVKQPTTINTPNTIPIDAYASLDKSESNDSSNLNTIAGVFPFF
jgi:hypothetical protein